MDCLHSGILPSGESYAPFQLLRSTHQVSADSLTIAESHYKEKECQSSCQNIHSKSNNFKNTLLYHVYMNLATEGSI